MSDKVDSSLHELEGDDEETDPKPAFAHGSGVSHRRADDTEVHVSRAIRERDGHNSAPTISGVTEQAMGRNHHQEKTESEVHDVDNIAHNKDSSTLPASSRDSRGIGTSASMTVTSKKAPVLSCIHDDTKQSPDWASLSPYTDPPTSSGGSALSDAEEGNSSNIEGRSGTFTITFEKPSKLGRRRRSNSLTGIKQNRVGAAALGSEELNSKGDQGSSETSVDPSGAYLILSEPPTGHHGDFKWEVPRSRFHGTWTDDDETATFTEDSLAYFDEHTLFGNLHSLVAFKESDTLRNKATQKQAKNGLRLADHMVKVPLSKVWHTFTEVFANAVFLANVIVAIVDIVRGPTFLHYKVTALILGAVENLVVLILWLVNKSSKFKNSPNKDKYEKYQQYAENIMHEVLMYPLLMVSVVGFATEKMYQSTDAFSWTQFILLLVDTCQLIYTQIVRVYMVYRLMRDLRTVLKPQDQTQSSSSVCTPSNIFMRAFLNIAGNLVLFLFLTTMLTIQSHKENYTAEDYRAENPSALLMFCLVLLPNLSIFLFVCANIFWILEILVTINLNVATKAEFQDDLKDKYGLLVAEAMEFAKQKIPTSAKRLETIRKTPLHKKMLYSVYEIPILVLYFLWECLLVICLYYFDAFGSEIGADQTVGNTTMEVFFVVLLIIANPQVVLLMFISNFMVAGLVFGMLFYPLSIFLCCRRRDDEPDKESLIK